MRTLIEVVQRVHRKRLTEQHFGRPIPLLIHELEYHQEIARQNVEANGIDRVRGFVDWIRGGYSEPKRTQFDKAMGEADAAHRDAMS